MRGYRAVVIDGKKVIRRVTALLCAVAVALLAVINIKISGARITESRDMGERIIGESIPAVFAADGAEDGIGNKLIRMARKATCFFLTFDPSDLRTAIFTEIPLMKIVGQGQLAMTAYGNAVETYNPENADIGEGEREVQMPKDKKSYPIKAVDSSQGKALGTGKSKILIRNDTQYSINIEEMLDTPLSFDMKGDGPKILILHTHATESYTPEGVNTYSPDKSDRSLNADENMIKVGESMKNIFEEKGIETIHDTTLHDHPNFNGSYANSLKTAEGYKAKYPSIRIILDIHRDAFIYEDGQKAKFVTEINGKKAAQLMMVVGTDAGGLDHPNWRENMKLALKLQSFITNRYPYLMRGVNLRKERFNGHTTYGSMIIEVGASGNSMEEAVYGASCGAAAIAEFLTGI